METDLSANVVSATGRSLVFNEAQDIDIAKAYIAFGPMGASENATKLYSGTRWTEERLLERELKAALAAMKQDGIRRVFMVDADQGPQIESLVRQVRGRRNQEDGAAASTHQNAMLQRVDRRADRHVQSGAPLRVTGVRTWK